MLGLTGYSTNTGGGGEAARLLSDLGWSEVTWTTQVSHLSRWLLFCDEYIRNGLPSYEGDVRAFIGYISLEGHISPESLLQYVSAVSRYHKLHYFDSQTRTKMVRSLMKAYSRSFESTDTALELRIVLPANLMHLVVVAGIDSTNKDEVDFCTTTLFTFVFQVWSISLSHLRFTDLVVDSTGVHATIHRRKSVRLPLVLRYLKSPSYDSVNPVAFLKKWLALHPDPESGLCRSLTKCLHRSLTLIDASSS